MGKNSKSRIPEVLKKFEKELLADWVKEQLSDNCQDIVHKKNCHDIVQSQL